MLTVWKSYIKCRQTDKCSTYTLIAITGTAVGIGQKRLKKNCAEMLHISMLYKEKHLVATVKHGDGLVMLGAIL